MEVATMSAPAPPTAPNTSDPHAGHPEKDSPEPNHVPTRAQPSLDHHSPMSLAAFPSEIFAIILGFSDARSIRRCQQVCRMLRNLVATNQHLQYLLELDLCGYIVPASLRLDVSYTEMIQMLREHRKRWQQTELADSTFFPFLPELTPRWGTFVDGTFACSYTTTAHLNEPISAIHFDQLPSPNRGTGHQRWQFRNFGFEVMNFLIQPELNLLVLLEEELSIEYPAESWEDPITERYYYIHLRTMSDNKPHPAAKAGAVLSLDPGERADPCTHEAFHPQLNGRLFGILFSSKDGRKSSFILVMDWVSGMEVANIEVPGQSFYGSFGLLSDDYFVIPSKPDPNPMPHTYDTLGYLDIYHIPPENPETRAREAHFLASFMLPDLPVEQTNLRLELQCGYAPAPPRSPRSTLLQPSSRIFESAPGTHLVSLDITVEQRERTAGSGFRSSHSASKTLYLSSQTLLDIVNQELDGDTASDVSTLIQVPWEAWGHRTSLSEPHVFSFRQPPHTWGLRTAGIEGYSGRSGNETPKLFCVDFEPGRVRARRAEGCELGGEVSSSRASNNDGGNAHVQRNVLEQAFSDGDAAPKQQYVVTSMTMEGEERMGKYPRVMIGDEHIVVMVRNNLVHDHVEPGIFVYTL